MTLGFESMGLEFAESSEDVQYFDLCPGGEDCWEGFFFDTFKAINFLGASSAGVDTATASLNDYVVAYLWYDQDGADTALIEDALYNVPSYDSKMEMLYSIAVGTTSLDMSLKSYGFSVELYTLNQVLTPGTMTFNDMVTATKTLDSTDTFSSQLQGDGTLSFTSWPGPITNRTLNNRGAFFDWRPKPRMMVPSGDNYGSMALVKYTTKFDTTGLFGYSGNYTMFGGFASETGYYIKAT